VTSLNRWRYFLQVAETASVSRAAEKLGLSQPALSRQIALLEGELGASLFRRTGRGLALTQAGVAFRAKAVDILRRIAALPEEIAADGGAATGPVAFGAPPFMGRILTGALVANFVAQCPLARLRVRGAHTFQLREALLLREIDLAIVSMPLAEPEIAFEPLLREEMRLIGPPGDDRLATGQPVSLARVAELPLILTPRPDSLRLVVENAIETTGRTARVTVESEYGPMDELVRRGLGYTVLPACAIVNTPLAGFPSAPVRGLHITWALARLEAARLSVAARILHGMIHDDIRRLVETGVWRGHLLATQQSRPVFRPGRR
jgi:LysR family nitrogen assimilation transcriptional regulator